MTDADFEALCSALTSRWPLKFTEADVIPWMREFDPYPLPAVVEAIDTWAQQHAYAPKTLEIREMLKQQGVQPTTPRRERRRSALAESIVKMNPHVASHSDSELVAAHHRALFTMNRVNLEQWSACGGTGRSEMMKARLDAVRNSTIRQCIADLVAVGVTIDVAQRVSDTVTGDDDEAFKTALEDVREVLFT